MNQRSTLSIPTPFRGRVSGPYPLAQYSKEDHILLQSENLLTVCEPTDEIVKAYLKKVGKTEEDLKTTSRPVMLPNEEVQDQIPFDDDEDYWLPVTLRRTLSNS